MKNVFFMLGIIIFASIFWYRLQEEKTINVPEYSQVNSSTRTSNIVLSQEVIHTLEQALDDEYKAYATYNEVLNTFGSVRPFSNIIIAEENHANAIKAIYTKYGLIPKQNTYLEPTHVIIIADTIIENCELGIQAEKANVDLYRNNLLPLVQQYPDIVSVFEKNLQASEQNHLRAFTNCSSDDKRLGGSRGI